MKKDKESTEIMNPATLIEHYKKKYHGQGPNEINNNYIAIYDDLNERADDYLIELISLKNSITDTPIKKYIVENIAESILKARILKSQNKHNKALTTATWVIATATILNCIILFFSVGREWLP